MNGRDIGTRFKAAVQRKMKRDAWLHMARGMRIAGADYPAICYQLAKEECDAETIENICDALWDCECEERMKESGGEE